MLLFLGRRLTENAFVILHQLTYHQEDVDSRHTVGYQARDIIALGAGLSSRTFFAHKGSGLLKTAKVFRGAGMSEARSSSL